MLQALEKGHSGRWTQKTPEAAKTSGFDFTEGLNRQWPHRAVFADDSQCSFCLCGSDRFPLRQVPANSDGAGRDEPGTQSAKPGPAGTGPGHFV